MHELKLPRVYFRREAAQQSENLRPNHQPGPGYTPMLGASQLHGNGPWSNLTKNNMGRGFLPCRLDARRSAHPGNFRQHLQQRQWWWLAVICMHAWSSHIICKFTGFSQGVYHPSCAHWHLRGRVGVSCPTMSPMYKSPIRWTITMQWSRWSRRSAEYNNNDTECSAEYNNNDTECSAKPKDQKPRN